MKIAVVIPPVKDFYWTYHRASFIGAHIVKNLLNKYFKDVILISPFLKNKVKKIPLPSYISYLNPFMDNKYFFKSFKLFGMDINSYITHILSFQPDVIIISIFAFCYCEEALELADKIKKINSKIYIGLGGAGVSVFPEFFSQFSFIDLIINGEIETVIENVVDCIIKKKKDVIYSKRKSESEELEFYLIKTFETNNIVSYSTILTRGCPRNCSFCANKLIFGKKLRFTPIFKIENYLKKFSFSNKKVIINFEDDNILFFKEYFFDVIKILKNYIPSFIFSFENGIEFNLLSEKDIEFLIKMGIKQFNFSIVNINPKILKNSNRNFNISKFIDILKIISNFNIKTITYFIAGLLGDDFENILKNIYFLEKQPTIIGFSAFYPVPGLYENELKIKEKLLKGEIFPGLLRGSSMKNWFYPIKIEDLISGFILTRIVNELTI